MRVADRPLDTSPDADAIQIETYRRMSGAARVAIAFRLGTLVRETALAARSLFNAIESQHDRPDRPARAPVQPRSITKSSGRRMAVDLSFARSVDMVTPEDAILSKLEWARRSGDSERQLADARGVLQVNPNIDRG